MNRIHHLIPRAIGTHTQQVKYYVSMYLYAHDMVTLLGRFGIQAPRSLVADRRVALAWLEKHGIMEKKK